MHPRSLACGGAARASLHFSPPHAATSAPAVCAQGAPCASQNLNGSLHLLSQTLKLPLFPASQTLEQCPALRHSHLNYPLCTLIVPLCVTLKDCACTSFCPIRRRLPCQRQAAARHPGPAKGTRAAQEAGEAGSRAKAEAREGQGKWQGWSKRGEREGLHGRSSGVRPDQEAQAAGSKAWGQGGFPPVSCGRWERCAGGSLTKVDGGCQQKLAQEARVTLE